MTSPFRSEEQLHTEDMGILVFDHEGEIQFADASFRAVIGLPMENLIGLPLRETISSGGWIFDLYHRLEDGEEKKVSSRFPGSASNRTICVTVCRLGFPSEKGFGVAFFWDHAREQPQAMDIPISKLLAKFAHEMRNPLAAVRGLVDLLADGLAQEEQHEVIQRICFQIARLEKLTKEIANVRPSE